MFEQKTPREVKSSYVKLAFELAGNPTKSRQLTEAYHTALSHLDGTVYVGADNQEHRYFYHRRREDVITATVERLAASNLPPNVTVEIRGIWLWVSGTERHDMSTRGALGALGFRWHPKHKQWYLGT